MRMQRRRNMSIGPRLGGSGSDDRIVFLTGGDGNFRSPPAA